MHSYPEFVHNWFQELIDKGGAFSALLAKAREGSGPGFQHTVLEICQQPATWTVTAQQMAGFREDIAASLAGCERVVLTGSGSSQYAGECAAAALQRSLRRPVEVAGGGELLLRRKASVAGEPALVLSLARSGDSPESTAVIETLLQAEPGTKHLIVTCNEEGRMLKEFAGNKSVRAIRLSPQVNDRSLVMTSSFTNLVLGARALSEVERPSEFAAIVDVIAGAGRQLLACWPDRLAEFVSGDVHRAVFLASGGRMGAAHEASLKMLEMTAGRIATKAESYLGLRHGPMCFIDEKTLVVCFLSSDPLIRRYEEDLICEINAKKLGARKLIAGAGDAGAGLCNPDDLAIRYDLPLETQDDDLALLDAMAGQLLGFHRSRQEGLNPDSPSADGIISRVVGEFRIHRTTGA